MGLGANLTRTAMHAGRVRPGNNRRKKEWFQDLGIHGTEAEKKHVQKWVGLIYKFNSIVTKFLEALSLSCFGFVYAFPVA